MSIAYFNQTDELNFIYEINCTENQFDSYQLMYRNSSSAVQFLTRPIISQGCNITKQNIEFVYQTEFLYGTTYEIKIRTFGCNNSCNEDSKSFFVNTS